MQQLPTYKEVLALIRTIVHSIHTVEQIQLEESVGRILAHDIVADRDIPPYNRSQMDGYAVVASEVEKGVSMEVLEQVAAGSTYEGEHRERTCVYIATGAPVPDCFDAVVPHEQTDHGMHTVCFTLDEVKAGASIHPLAVDAKAGDILISGLTTLSPHHVGIAATVGATHVSVLAKPRVIVVTSGDEVVHASDTPLPHQIRNGNNPMICAVFAAMGCEIVASHHVSDDPEETNAIVTQSLDGGADLLVTVGGISAGNRDYFPAAFKQAGVSIAVAGASIQPGKPVIVGQHAHGIVLGLPGNPVSALACSCVLGWSIVRSLLGIFAELPWQEYVLGHDVLPNPQRLLFRPCTCCDGTITIPNWQGSGDLVHTKATDGLVQIPSSDDTIVAGTSVQFLAWP